MGVFNFRTTGNESFLFDRVFPVGYAIHEAHEDPSLTSYPELSVSAPTVCKLALDSSNVYAVEPNGWVRVLSKEDQGTDESHNWPDPECKFSVRLTDEQSAILETLAKRYFMGNKTYAMVWAITNFNALLAKDPGRLKVTKTKQAKPMSQQHTKLVSIRLPLELLADYEDQARAMHISVGRLLREQIIANWAGIRPTPTPTEQDTDDADDFLDDFEDL
jgi:hypothetical protein